MVVKMEKEINESEEDEDMLKFGIIFITFILTATVILSAIITNGSVDRNIEIDFDNNDCDCEDYYYNETFVIGSLRYTFRDPAYKLVYLNEI